MEAARLMARGTLRLSGVDRDRKRDEQEIDEALAAFGLRAEEPVEIEAPQEIGEPFYLWPECAETFFLWRAVQTQWVKDMGVRIGLNYEGIEAFFRMHMIRGTRRQEIFQGFQAMELAALSEWRSKQ